MNNLVARFDTVARLIVVFATVWLGQLVIHEVLHFVFAIVDPHASPVGIMFTPTQDIDACDQTYACAVVRAGEAASDFDDHLLIYPAQWLVALQLLWGFSFWFRPEPRKVVPVAPEAV